MSPLSTIPLVATLLSFIAGSPRQPFVHPLSTPPAPHAMRAGDPQTKVLRTTIDSMIALLKVKEYHPFLSRFMEPDPVRQYGVDAMAEMFTAAKWDLLLSVLKEIRNREPLYGRDGALATFTIRKRADLPRDQINFTRIGELWYMAS